MSRHRFVRNMDIDAEMAEDEDDGFTMNAEEKAQMATALPIARQLLSDLKPTIPDSAIFDSLWHYWFDVDKAVSWLRKDWEKKGSPIPQNLLPTPDNQRRRGSNKSPRIDSTGTSIHEPASGPTSSAASSSSVPLTALQRLSLAREGSSSTIPTTSGSSTPAPPSSALETSSTPSKPKRREAAAAAAATAPSIASTRPSIFGNSDPGSSGKPLSKLAQKNLEDMPAKDLSRETPRPLADELAALSIDDEMAQLFASGSSGPTDADSSFFDILTAPITKELEPVSSVSLHLPFDDLRLEDRVREAFGADVLSPDDIVLRAQAAAKSSGLSTPKSASLPGKPREQQGVLKAKTQPGTPRSGKASAKPGNSGAATPVATAGPSGLQHDLAALHLEQQGTEEDAEREKERYKERPALNMKQEELIAKVIKDEEETGKKNLSLVVVGHVDAGKSTLMGRLLYDIGELSEKEKTANERGSKKIGKGSFAFAWGLDALGDERDRGVTIDIATTHFDTPHRNITLLDAPGHRDFIPAMISGAAQADVALLVVDGSPGEFEAGFERGGQTREHAWLVRSLGVKEIIVGINKMDVVEWSQDRYDEIVSALKPFLLSAGFAPAKTVCLPLAAMEGINIVANDEVALKSWYDGPTLMDSLDKIEVPTRPYDSALRIPVSNVFKGQTAVASGVAVTGRLCSGVLQVGDRLRAVPGDEVASVRTIEIDDDSAPYAVAGQNVTLYLSGIDAIHLAIGTVLCPTSLPVPMVSRFSANILVFDVSSPIIVGAAVELFHHSINVPATISKLVSVSEKGTVTRKNPRVLQKGMTALVEITLRLTNTGGKLPTLPLETAAENKEMGRVLIRRQGETIAAGVVQELLQV
ncbi:hypothetical protein BD324DRAFT_643762 [Kockovaella imperatae]|uniref:Elongation factor 1 alpha-like protein n=1 Tax=Kockovaella imperatae TaxID=4999 RepID=A0A1Y1U6Z6_9TREE|nr:hypothetical protein BD324DRAFT_643762 [Kockovaella imperatae]ORX33788.1 hypothetical protein BD324DRAFT_643762 [Kockovaella imperatae]